jgi:hypothetical protein
MLAYSVSHYRGEPVTTAPLPHYRRPGWFTRNLFNRAVAIVTRLGLSVWGSRVLEVPGRRTGQPRGHGEWVRNVRANGGRLDLLLGRRRTHHVATELADEAKVQVLRAYLRRWKAEVGVFFDGVDASSTDAEILAIAAKHPVFQLDAA